MLDVVAVGEVVARSKGRGSGTEIEGLDTVGVGTSIATEAAIDSGGWCDLIAHN